MYYKKTTIEIFKELHTSEKGLSSEETLKRLKIFGFNSTKPKKKRSMWHVFFHQFADPLIYILLIAGVFTLYLGHYIDSTVILLIVMHNVVVGFIQEYKAEKAIQAIKQLTGLTTVAVKNGTEERIKSSEIVPGDIIVLTAGNKVPADMRIIEAKEFEVDEASLTGESIPVKKQTKALSEDNIPIINQNNMAFMGTIILHGKAKGVVVKTGAKTELGKITLKVEETKKELTPLQQRLKDFSIKIGIVSLSLAFIVFVIGLSEGIESSEMILFSVSMAIAIIPEGLPIVITITMAIGLKKMADKNAIMRRLIAVETLGSCDYICTDKTGTITENQMTVTKACINGNIYDFTGIGYNPKGEIFLNNTKIIKDDELEQLLLTGLLCNSSTLYKEGGEWKIDGDPTEGALIVAAEKYGINIEKKELQYQLVDEIPFSSKRQYMATLYKTKEEQILFVKGAPEKMLSFSQNINITELSNQYLNMAESGLRILGFGLKKISLQNREIDFEKEATHNLKFVGFQGIIDPPREAVSEALKNTKIAGINTIMLTGDHKVTATAIAKQIGILEMNYPHNKMVVTGQEMELMSNDFLFNNIENIAVYARVSPEHKFKIIEMLQRKGHIVAVTGDGINDAPALKKANIGVAMGKIGTDVAKEAADIILKDDNYASIFEAVKVGRVVFENIRKVVYFLLGTGGAIPLTIVLSLFLHLPLPFLATQVLWINLVTNGLQDLALAYEPSEENIFIRPPRNPKEGVINYSMLRQMLIVALVGGIGTFFMYRYQLKLGHDLTFARTTAMNTMVFFQFFQVINSRSFEKSIFQVSPFSNPFLFISWILALIAQISILNFAPLQLLFHTTNLDSVTWAQTIFVASTIILVVEIDKFFRKKLRKDKEKDPNLNS